MAAVVGRLQDEERASLKRPYEELERESSRLSPASPYLRSEDGSDPVVAMQRRIKRARLEFYKGYAGFTDEERLTFVLAFTKWIARTHGFSFLRDTETQQPRFTSFPPNLAGAADIPHWLWDKTAAGGAAAASKKEIPWLPQLSLFPADIRETTSDASVREEMQVLDDAVGHQSQALVVGLLVSMAALSAVIDGDSSLACCYCHARVQDFEGGDPSRSDRDFLLTIAREHVPTCQNPLIAESASRIAWASSLFESEPVVPGQDRRQGAAVCLKCLYERVMRRDDELMQVITLMPTLREAFYANDARHTSARRICACRHPEPDQPGTLCLFSFSRVLSRNAAALKVAGWDKTILPALMKQLIPRSSLTDLSAEEEEKASTAFSFPAANPRLGRLVGEALYLPSCTLQSAFAASLDKAADQRVSPLAPAASMPPVLLFEDRMDVDTPSVSPPSSSTSSPALPLPSLHSAILLGHLPSAEYRRTMPREQHAALVLTALPWVVAFYESLERLGATLPVPMASIDPELVKPSSGEPVAKRKSKTPKKSSLMLSSSTTATAEEGLAESGGGSSKPATERGMYLSLPPAHKGGEAQVCELCGGPGHKIAKTCPFFTPADGFKARSGLTVFEHMADNVESHMKDSRGEFGRLVRNASEQAAIFGALVLETMHKEATGAAQRRGGPRPEHLPPTVSHSTARGSKASSLGQFQCASGVALLLPAVEMETILAIPLERYPQLLALDSFFDTSYIQRTMLHFSRVSMQVGDLLALFEWVTAWRAAHDIATLTTYTHFAPDLQPIARQELYDFYHSLAQHLSPSASALT
jgi:hypothetical protein